MGDPTDSATIETVVTRSDTARALGSGDVEALGTPRVLALAEAATVRAAPVEPGQTTVGTHVELDHLAPSKVGAVVTAHATLVYRTGRRLTFEVRVTQGDEIVATGRITRVIVDRARFQASTDERG